MLFVLLSQIRTRVLYLVKHDARELFDMPLLEKQPHLRAYYGDKLLKWVAVYILIGTWVDDWWLIVFLFVPQLQPHWSEFVEEAPRKQVLLCESWNGAIQLWSNRYVRECHSMQSRWLRTACVYCRAPGKIQSLLWVPVGRRQVILRMPRVIIVGKGPAQGSHGLSWFEGIVRPTG